MSSDVARALDHYRTLAPRYDHYTPRINKVRARAIAALGLRAGETVLDAGCGTGWCLPMIGERIGPAGRIIAFDPSPEMLALARARLPAHGPSVELLRATGEDVVLPAATSTKLYAPWLFPANWYLRYTHRAYITNFESFDAPGSLLATLLDDFGVETSGWTQHYVATGRVRA